jgi:hypothetical protein
VPVSGPQNQNFNYTLHKTSWGPGSSVDIATGYGLDGPGIESRWGARFSAPVQTGPGAHPASCTMGTGSFPGVESGRGVTLTPHPLLVPRSKKRNRAITLLSLRAFVACKKGETYLQNILPIYSFLKMNCSQPQRFNKGSTWVRCSVLCFLAG